MGKTIHTYLWADDINGMKEIFIPGDGCVLFYIPRLMVNKVDEQKDEFEVPALYILINEKDNKAYVGETDNFRDRIKNHNTNKEFWDSVIMLKSSDNQLTTTEVKYLEAKAYELAKKIGRFDLSENTQHPKAPRLQRYRQDFVDDFFQKVIFFIEFSGCKIFTPRENQTLNGKRITKQYSLNKSNKLSGCKFVRAIVETYIKRHKQTTYKELLDVFPRSMMKGESGQTVSTYADAYSNHNKQMAEKIFLKKTNKPIRLSDGTEIYVNTQTDSVIVERFIEFANQQGWETEEF